ncbi:hypothetical protein [Marinomonas mediterranea]|jgi:hypothetical protein|uniref:IrrE N-terminal-like domain-containing protein n=1 Tax=Marinomonas mediterranea (strain ATCC 700492 / JCM 21426 / NBRC 103028 / MMB-1) TaxID=717774 RepID=F2K3S6_MARM1|nr:hypothetical protein [Marinomonas mediterranea]ADZ90175.1 hypothetical protein Marme_0900 [Marinomonas mediterranea MMB-1]WCN08236.1 hypothetical protein GV055_04545 [Marinomonas mediterranea]WCN12302.1 hypothetical protein GV054_04445 [Marinomonas mediterranea]WCN16374.1 hypothetical protein GV053_04550 [Marinomonas mediterranea MMB-1]
MEKAINTILNFFDEISLPYQLVHLDDKTFLPGIKIDNGGLLIDTEKLLHPGDLLHEAGHIAINPPADRTELSGDMKYAGHTGAEETAAIAWSYAACKYINLDVTVLFHKEGYKGGSSNMIDAFESGGGFGFPLLQYWQMCEANGTPEGYPKMKVWLRSN